MFIVDDEFDASLPLPRGERDIPLLIADRAFDRRNQLSDPFSAIAHAPNDGVTGRYVLVNGAHLPHHRVSATRHRLRVLNASNFRSYNLELAGGAQMTQIATESGLMPRPVTRRQVLVGPGERVELVDRLRRLEGERVELRSVPRRGAPDALGSTAFDGPLMQFRVGRRAPDETSVPASLRPLPAWVAQAPRGPLADVALHDRRRPAPDLAGQRKDLRPGALGRLPQARHHRDLGASQRDRGRPPDPPPPHRLVHALAQRQAAAPHGSAA